MVFDQEAEGIVLFASDDNSTDKLGHVYCQCAPNVGLCGAELSATLGLDLDPNYSYTPDAEDCIVCLALEFTPCERCNTHV